VVIKKTHSADIENKLATNFQLGWILFLLWFIWLWIPFTPFWYSNDD